jgi:acyl-coenzyme A thioesterase PaaI-like protein
MPSKPLFTEEIVFRPSDRSQESYMVAWYLREKEKQFHGEAAPAKTNSDKKDLVPSGLLSCLLDQAMTRLVDHFHGASLTAETTVRYLAPALVDEPLSVMGRIVDDTKRLITAQAEISKTDGTPVARAESRILMLKKD